MILPSLPQGARTDRRGAVLAPVQPWDALICTSPAVRQCLEGILDRWQEHLSQRFGGTRAPRPQLPLLPLGVDQGALVEKRSDQCSRDFLRRHLRIDEQDVLVLWLGDYLFLKILSTEYVYRPSESDAKLWAASPFRNGRLVPRWRE